MKSEVIKVGKGFKVPILVDTPIMDMTISDLNLSTRMENAMHRAGFFTIGKFVRDWPLDRHRMATGFKNTGDLSWRDFWSKLIDAQFEVLSDQEADRYAQRIIAVNYLEKGE